MSYESRSQQAVNLAEVASPREILLLRYVSSITGHAYGEEMVDHLGDMILIFYAAGGTVLGAIVGCVLSVPLYVREPTIMRFLLVVPPLVFLGALLGYAGVLSILNLRGLVRWDNSIVKGTATLKGASSDGGDARS